MSEQDHVIKSLQRENEELRQRLAAMNARTPEVQEEPTMTAPQETATPGLDEAALSIVVIGASGDLAKKKTYPSLFTLFRDGLLPEHVQFFGYARSDLPLDKFHSQISGAFKGTDEQKQKFLDRCHYVHGQYDSVEHFKRLASALEESEKKNKGPAANRVFYFAIPPSVFLDVSRCVAAGATSRTGFNRIVVEKPFGHDRASARELTKSMGQLFTEDQLFRIDHYLGKELVLNVLVLRFANLAFVPLWNRDHVSSVTITFKEDIGLEGRAGYFDTVGLIRDVMQNHLLQVLALVAMEPPVSLSAEHVRDEKVKVLRAASEIKVSDVVVGQFEGYKDDKDVPSDSITPTYAAAVVWIRNQRWDGVPFILKCGKGLNERKTDVRIQFRDVPGNLFKAAQPNELVLRVQPNEAIYMKMMTKVPGLSGIEDLAFTELDLSYKARYAVKALPDAYERLILDVVRGDHTHFVRSDELDAAWAIFTPMLHQLEREKVPPVTYKFGSRGPKEADELVARMGFRRSVGYTWQSPY